MIAADEALDPQLSTREPRVMRPPPVEPLDPVLEDPEPLFHRVPLSKGPGMLMSALFGVFNILFAIWFARFYRQTASTRSTVFLGSLTLLVPSILAAVAWVGLPPDVALGVYMGPVPIQLATGLLLMYLVKRVRIGELWDDSLASSDWWKKDQSLREQSESPAK
jgi:hypothetical protein